MLIFILHHRSISEVSISPIASRKNPLKNPFHKRLSDKLFKGHKRLSISVFLRLALWACEEGNTQKTKTTTNVVDPDPHGSALIWLSWIRICIGNTDPEEWN
jgi:hypothetical protein